MADEIVSPIETTELLAGVIKDDVVYEIVQLKEISGVEEDILAEKGGSVSEKISRILTNCIVNLSAKTGELIEDKKTLSMLVKKMVIGDRIYLFIKLRSISLGSKFLMEFVAPSDGTKFSGTIDLDTLETTVLEDKTIRTKEVVLSNDTIVIGLGTGLDEEALSKVANSKTRLTTSLMQRIVSFNQVRPSFDVIQKLGIKDRNKIRQALEDFDAGVDTTVIAVDPGTGEEFETQLDMGQKSFFFPSEI
jgi:hypothetical protein